MKILFNIKLISFKMLICGKLTLQRSYNIKSVLVCERDFFKFSAAFFDSPTVCNITVSAR